MLMTSPTWITDNLSTVTQHLEPQLIKATFFFSLLSGISINFSGEWSSSTLIFSRTLNISVLVFVIGINNQTWAYSPAAKYISYFFQTELKYTCLVLGHNTNCELWYTCLISWYPQWHGQKKKRNWRPKIPAGVPWHIKVHARLQCIRHFIKFLLCTKVLMAEHLNLHQ